MKNILKSLFAAFLIVSFILPCNAFAQREEKGFLVRWWERIRKKEIAPVPAPSQEKAEKKKEPVKKVIEIQEIKEELDVIAVPEEKEEISLKIPEQEIKKEVPVEDIEKKTTEESEQIPVEQKHEEARGGIPEEEQAGLEIKDKVPASSEKPGEGEGPKVGDELEEPVPESEKKLTKRELIDTIKTRVKTFSQIPYMIPKFFVIENEQGEREYLYGESELSAVPLSQLDEKTLRKLFARVNNEATRINTERIIRQMQQQEQIMRTIRQQQIHQPPTPPQPPRVYTPPPVPQPPPQPPQPVQPPPPPPNRR